MVAWGNYRVSQKNPREEDAGGEVHGEGVWRVEGTGETGVVGQTKTREKKEERNHSERYEGKQPKEEDAAPCFFAPRFLENKEAEEERKQKPGLQDPERMERSLVREGTWRPGRERKEYGGDDTEEEEYRAKDDRFRDRAEPGGVISLPREFSKQENSKRDENRQFDREEGDAEKIDARGVEVEENENEEKGGEHRRLTVNSQQTTDNKKQGTMNVSAYIATLHGGVADGEQGECKMQNAKGKITKRNEKSEYLCEERGIFFVETISCRDAKFCVSTGRQETNFLSAGWQINF